jgi:hypothetical protein
MTLTQAVQILRDHNAWRRFDGEGADPPDPSPKLVGQAIDLVCDVAPELLGHLQFAHAALRGLPGFGSSAQVAAMAAAIAKAGEK